MRLISTETRSRDIRRHGPLYEASPIQSSEEKLRSHRKLRIYMILPSFNGNDKTDQVKLKSDYPSFLECILKHRNRSSHRMNHTHRFETPIVSH